MKALETMREEHRTILSVAAATRDEMRREQLTGDFDPSAVEEFITFFRWYAGSWHERKEEDFLYTALRRHGLSWDSCPLRDLLRDHARLGVALDSAADWVPVAAAGYPSASWALAHDLGAYLDLMGRHIGFEEESVYPLVRYGFSGAEMDRLDHDFAASGGPSGATHAFCLDLARRVETAQAA